ncbi:hypothetical protein AB0C14_15030 [Microbispora hainanensis]|uniref:hypothetical protein n=1 Tax=Microbispora hainanensis TaxID=568844 RepID=UPI0033CE3BD8
MVVPRTAARRTVPNHDPPEKGMTTMAGMELEERVTALETDVQSFKILVHTVDDKVERARLDIQQAQGANIRLFQATRDDVMEFRSRMDSRFAEMRARFDLADERFTAMEDRSLGIQAELKFVNRRLDGLDTRMDHVETRLDGLDARMDRVETRLDGIDQRLDGMDERLDKMDARIERVETRLDGIDQRLDGMDARFDKVDARFDEVIALIKDRLVAQG